MSPELSPVAVKHWYTDGIRASGGAAGVQRRRGDPAGREALRRPSQPGPAGPAPDGERCVSRAAGPAAPRGRRQFRRTHRKTPMTAQDGVLTGRKPCPTSLTRSSRKASNRVTAVTRLVVSNRGNRVTNALPYPTRVTRSSTLTYSGYKSSNRANRVTLGVHAARGTLSGALGPLHSLTQSVSPGRSRQASRRM